MTPGIEKRPQRGTASVSSAVALSISYRRMLLATWQYPFCCAASSNGTESPALTPKEGKG